MQIHRKYTFSAGENSNFSQWGSGADWELEVTLQGPIDEITGLVVNLIDVDEIVRPCLHMLDKKHLNKEVDFFKNRQANPENLAEFCFYEIEKKRSELWGEAIPVNLVRIIARKPILKQWGLYGQIN